MIAVFLFIIQTLYAQNYINVILPSSLSLMKRWPLFWLSLRLPFGTVLALSHHQKSIFTLLKTSRWTFILYCLRKLTDEINRLRHHYWFLNQILQKTAFSCLSFLFSQCDSVDVHHLSQFPYFFIRRICLSEQIKVYLEEMYIFYPFHKVEIR